MGVLQALIEQRRMDQQAAKDLANNIGDLARRIRVRRLTDAFYKQGDFSPEGIKKFAEQNKLSVPEMLTITKAVSAFKQYQQQQDPWVQVTEVQPDGTKVTKLMRQSELRRSGGVVTGKPSAKKRLEQKIIEGKINSQDLTPEQRALLGLMKSQKFTRLSPGQELYDSSGKRIAKNEGSALADPYKLLDTAIKVLRDQLPKGDILGLNVEELTDPSKRQNAIQIFEKAANSDNLHIRQAGKAALFALQKIFKPIEQAQQQGGKNKKIVKAYLNLNTGQFVTVYDDGTVSYSGGAPR